jgi:hypothetical protein
VLDEGRHSWVDRAAVVTELREVARRQAADPRQREMSYSAQRLARAFGTYPHRVFNPLVR